MRRIVTAAVLAAAVALVTGAAAPALALTVTPAPNRDQAPPMSRPCFSELAPGPTPYRRGPISSLPKRSPL